ncbi:MAG: universal stress protein [Desulfobulbaceae bacterium]|nr:universal stress protein [Desulfobulbaceae bacterium]
MSLNIYLAYDGSINADWVSRYAIHMAANAASRKIVLIHILDGNYSVEKINAKIQLLEDECLAEGVELVRDIRPVTKSVYFSLLTAIPAGSENLCICGARISSRGKGFLAGTISEKLLRRKHFNVLAIRVVKPGLLGLPRQVFFPLSGHPRGLKGVMALFQLMVPQIEKVHLLRVMSVSSYWFQYMPEAKIKKMRLIGGAYLKEVLKEIRQQLDGAATHIDGTVILSDDWAKEILIQASHVQAQMIIMGASDRNLPSRFFYGNKIEQILRRTPCDVGIYRAL